MMYGKDRDPLLFIYEDIADQFEPSHFKVDFQNIGKNQNRH
jgi:hypothetical protein